MPAKEALSTRTCTLFLLYCYLIDNIWSLLITLTNLDDSKYWKIIQEHTHLVCVGLFISLVGGVVIFATILCISLNAPSISLLITVIAFLCFGMVHNLLNIEVERKLRKIYINQDAQEYQILTFMRNPSSYNHVRTVLKFPILLLKFYAVFKFASYVVEIRDSRINAPSARTNFHQVSESVPPPSCAVQPTAPPLTPPPTLDPRTFPGYSPSSPPPFTDPRTFPRYSPSSPPPPYPECNFQYSIDPPPPYPYSD